jgi:long-chain acyl-CoA synthetase
MYRRSTSRSVSTTVASAVGLGWLGLTPGSAAGSRGAVESSYSSFPAVQRRFRTDFRGTRSGRNFAGTWDGNFEIPGHNIIREEDPTMALQIKPESTLVELWAQVQNSHPTRRFMGSKMWVRGQLGYCWSTYDTINQEIDMIRNMIHAMGITKGCRMVVISENRYEWFVLKMACMQLGAHFVAVPTNVTPQEAQRIVKATRARLLCVETPTSYAAVKNWIGNVGDLQHVLCFEDQGEGSYSVAIRIAEIIPPEQRVKPITDIRPEDTACIMFTAGTTGSPKGVMLSHKCLVANISSVFAQFGEALGFEDLFMSLCPWTVAGALTVELWQVILKGAAVAIPPEVIEGFQDLTTVNPSVVVSPALPFQRAYNNIVDDIINRKLTKNVTRLTVGAITQSRVMMTKPPASIRTLSHALLGKFKTPFGTDLRLVVIIGHQLTKDQGELFADLDLFVVNTYGCLEAGGIVAMDLDVPTKLKALPGVEMRVVNDKNEVVVPGDLGEILIEAPHAMQGYFDVHIDENDAANSLVVYGNRTFVRTGDYGTMTGSWVSVKGNKDVLITLKDGKVVDPLEIETILSKSPFIKQVFIFGEGRPYLTALIVPLTLAISQHLRKVERRDGVPIVNDREKADCIRSELRRVSQDLPPRSHVRRFAFVDEFTISNGMMTPKMGYARQKIETHYVHYINQLYDDSPKFYGYAVDDYDDLF